MSLFDDASSFFSHQLHALKACVTLVKLETKLAILSIYPFFVTSIIAIILAMATWLIGVALGGYVLIDTYGHPVLVLSGLLLVHLILLGLSLKHALSNLKQMSFEQTRMLLTSSITSGHNHDFESATTKNHSEHRTTTATPSTTSQ
jgi:hypothetical protein